MRKKVLENEKDESILDLIDRLGKAADLTGTEIVDHWEADLCAIGIKKENRLVYVSTYNGKDALYYELELLNDIEVDKYTVLQRGNDVAENVLISIIKEYLKI